MGLKEFTEKSFALFGLPCIWDGKNYIIFDPVKIKMYCFDKQEDINNPNLFEQLVAMGFALNPESVFESSNRKQVTMIVTTDCNLACPYCYTYSKVNPVYLQPEMAVAILQTVVKPEERLYLQFFGGEPTLNFPCIKAVTQYIKTYIPDHFIYITTNGVIKDESVLDFLLESQMGFYLSLDGTKPFNDKNRVTCKERLGTYDDVIRTLRRILAVSLPVKMRSTVTTEGVGDMVPFAKEMFDMGVKLIHFCPKIELGRATSSYSEGTENFQDRFVEELDNVLDLARSYKAKVVTTGSLALGQPMRPYCKILDTEGKILITPEGRRTLCYGAQDEYHPIAENFLYGKFTGSEFEYNSNIKEVIDKAFSCNSAQCNDCFAQFVCSGGCLAENLSSTGQMDKIDPAWCQMQKKLWFSTILRIYKNSRRVVK